MEDFEVQFGTPAATSCTPTTIASSTQEAMSAAMPPPNLPPPHQALPPSGLSKRKPKTNFCCQSTVEKLPDEILVRILSLLPLKEATATSILSKRWSYLWRFAQLSLNFEFDALSLCPSSMKLEDYLKEKRESYINWVNSVVDQHSGDTDLFRVKYSLSASDRISINKWVKFALRNRSLERLELDFYLFVRFESCCKLSHKLVFSDESFVGLKSLKELFLNRVGVSGKHIDDLLSNAPLLERLSVRGSQELVHLRVSGKSLVLKHLEIFGGTNLEKVEIYEVNIVSLYFGHFPTKKTSKFILRDVPMLVELCIPFSDEYSFSQQFSYCVSQIEVLKLHDAPRLAVFYAGMELYEAYPRMPNLKHLHLEICVEDIDQDGGLSNLRALLEAFPNLQRLVLHVPRNRPQLPDSFINFYLFIKRPPRRFHECLKEVEILGYNAFGDIERITYLLRCCVALEKIVINCKYNNTPLNLALLRKEKILEHEKFARKHAMTQLKRLIPSYIEFVCL